MSPKETNDIKSKYSANDMLFPIKYMHIGEAVEVLKGINK